MLKNTEKKITKDMSPLLTAPEVAKILDISESMAYRLAQQGKIPSIKIGRCVRVDPGDLENFLNRKKSEREKRI